MTVSRIPYFDQYVAYVDCVLGTCAARSRSKQTHGQ